MKVLMFGWDFSTRLTSGLGTACFGLTKALTELGIEVNYILPQKNQKTKNGDSHTKGIEFNSAPAINGLIETLNFIQIPSFLSPYSPYTQQSVEYTNQKTPIKSSGQQLLTGLQTYASLSGEKIKGLDYDIIHAHDWPGFPAALAAKHSSNKPLIIQVHSTEIDRWGDHANNLIYNLEKKGFEMASFIIAVSNYTKNMLVEKYQIDPAKIAVIYPGFSSQIPYSQRSISLPAFEEKIITFCGRFAWQKGPKYFVNIASKLLEKQQNLRFIMAGEGSLRTSMIELVAKMGISRYFHFPGHLKHQEIAALYQVSDILLAPSESEPFGLVALEAALAGIPVIINKHAGITEVLPNLYKYDCKETDAVAAEIVNMLNETATTAEAVETNRNAASKLTWERAAKEVLNLYLSVLNLT